MVYYSNLDMTNYFYNGDSRMADIITRHVELIEMLPRFGISLGFGDLTVNEVCKKWNVDVDFFLLICNVYSFRDFVPTDDVVNNTDMTQLVPYLKASHSYYVSKRLPHIQGHLHHIAEKLPHKVASVFLRFFELYKNEVEAHFRSEETTLFPLIQKIVSGEHDAGLHISSFNDVHQDIEDKLQDLTQIIFKYLPETIADDDTTDVVTDLLLLARDLHKHSLIEEKILVPFVRHLGKDIS